ncbi:MAG: hypothetical protein HY748_17700 [Elusimicrobia bacterium]|nr:hypothetical protein [Elusimicrobiota bacterium]
MSPDDPSAPPPPPPGAPIPPAPPAPELVRPAPTPAQQVPRTPMMDFMERRLAALEADLARERERASSAESVLKAQASMRSEVEAQLKALTDQLRREKSDRDHEESSSQAKGRISALEERLDSLHRTWADLLKETLLGKEVVAKVWPAEVVGEMKEWRQALSALPRLVDAVADLESRQRGQDLQVKDELRALVGDLSAALRERFADAEHKREIDLAKADDRLGAVARERLALREAFDEAGHALRSDLLKERLAQEAAFNEALSGIAARIDDLGRRHAQSDRETSELKEVLGQALSRAEPKAKDAVMAELEHENADLRGMLSERIEALRRYTEERKRIEASMGESLLALNRELSQEKARGLEAGRRMMEKDLEITSLKDRLDMASKTVEERETRFACLAVERDEIARAMAAEAGRLRDAIEARRVSDETWAKKVAEMEKKLDEAADISQREAASRRDLASQAAVLSSHAAKALQERDAAVQGSASWQEERARLLEALRKKDDLISMLSASFQNILKK